MTVVFGTDLSGAPDAVAHVAARLALRAGDDLVLAHVSTDPRAGVVLGTADEAVLSDTRHRLDGLAAQLRADHGIRVETDLWAGAVADSLASAAESVVARSLVLAEVPPRRRGWLGTVSERVIRLARVPVLVIRDPGRVERWLAGLQPLRVLVGTDGGAAAARGMSFAASLGALGQVDVVAACIADPVAASHRYGLAVPNGHALSREAEAALRRDVAAQLAAAGLAGARIVIRAGTAAPESHLVVLAEAEGVDLVVVGVRKRSWIEEVWRGSVAHGVLRGAATNVAAVPRLLAEDRRAPAPPPRTIVVATDLSPAGDAAIPVGYGLVASGGTVHLVHVVDTERVPVAGQRARAADVVQRRLQERVPDGVSVATELHAVGGETAAAILALSERVGADAICIASLGRSALGATLLGSVSRDVVAGSRCPVVVVPPPRE